MDRYSGNSRRNNNNGNSFRNGRDRFRSDDHSRSGSRNRLERVQRHSRSRSPNRDYNYERDEKRYRHDRDNSNSNSNFQQQRSFNIKRENNNKKMILKNENDDKQVQKWISEESDFALQQKKNGCLSRINYNRSTLIDKFSIIIQILNYKNDEKKFINSEINELFENIIDKFEMIKLPNFIYNLSSLDEINNLLIKEIPDFLNLEKNQFNLNYWNFIIDLLNHQKLLLLSKQQENDDINLEKKLVEPVIDDINNIINNKSIKDLEILKIKVLKTLDNNNKTIDRDFWNELYKQLILKISELKIIKYYDEALKIQKYEFLKKQLKIASKSKIIQDLNDYNSQTVVYNEDLEVPKINYINQKDELGIRNTLSLNKFSEWIGSEREKIQTLQLIPLNENKQINSNEIHQPNINSISIINNPSTTSSTIKELYDNEVSEILEENEEIFNEEANINLTTTNNNKLKSSIMKNKTIKPRYFNRVQLGFEWNRYNQLHYNADNPPPKIVQGYRFNIFYPELINSDKSPNYKIIKEKQNQKQNQQDNNDNENGNEKTCIIKFISPEPYEDIAFRIVDREWDYSAKRYSGFKNRFENGVLQLHFRFKKIFYRK